MPVITLCSSIRGSRRWAASEGLPRIRGRGPHGEQWMRWSFMCIFSGSKDHVFFITARAAGHALLDLWLNLGIIKKKKRGWDLSFSFMFSVFTSYLKANTGSASLHGESPCTTLWNRWHPNLTFRCHVLSQSWSFKPVPGASVQLLTCRVSLPC